ncbi:MAG: hypothetical protein M1820_010488 [Bogoriella megaspora]|nr:MAG: hypothetical protein M1820_010488 [Bogoriella megaspora]
MEGILTFDQTQAPAALSVNLKAVVAKIESLVDHAEEFDSLCKEAKILFEREHPGGEFTHLFRPQIRERVQWHSRFYDENRPRLRDIRANWNLDALQLSQRFGPEIFDSARFLQGLQKLSKKVSVDEGLANLNRASEQRLAGAMRQHGRSTTRRWAPCDVDEALRTAGATNNASSTDTGQTFLPSTVTVTRDKAPEQQLRNVERDSTAIYRERASSELIDQSQDHDNQDHDPQRPVSSGQPIADTAHTVSSNGYSSSDEDVSVDIEVGRAAAKDLEDLSDGSIGYFEDSFQSDGKLFTANNDLPPPANLTPSGSAMQSDKRSHIANHDFVRPQSTCPLVLGLENGAKLSTTKNGCFRPRSTSPSIPRPAGEKRSLTIPNDSLYALSTSLSDSTLGKRKLSKDCPTEVEQASHHSEVRHVRFDKTPSPDPVVHSNARDIADKDTVHIASPTPHQPNTPKKMKHSIKAPVDVEALVDKYPGATLCDALDCLRANRPLTAGVIHQISSQVHHSQWRILEPLAPQELSLNHRRRWKMMNHDIRAVAWPIFVGQNHWVLGLADVESGSIELLNPLVRESYNIEACSALEKLGRLLSESEPRLRNVQWTVNQRQCPQQQNTYDCGVYVLVFLFYRLADRMIPDKICGTDWRTILAAMLPCSELEGQIFDPPESSVPSLEQIFDARVQMVRLVQPASFLTHCSGLVQEHIRASRQRLQQITVSKTIFTHLGKHSTASRHLEDTAEELARLQSISSQCAKINDEYRELASVNGEVGQMLQCVTAGLQEQLDEMKQVIARGEAARNSAVLCEKAAARAQVIMRKLEAVIDQGIVWLGQYENVGRSQGLKQCV